MINPFNTIANEILGVTEANNIVDFTTANEGENKMLIDQYYNHSTEYISG